MLSVMEGRKKFPNASHQVDVRQTTTSSRDVRVRARSPYLILVALSCVEATFARRAPVFADEGEESQVGHDPRLRNKAHDRAEDFMGAFRNNTGPGAIPSRTPPLPHRHRRLPTVENIIRRLSPPKVASGIFRRLAALCVSPVRVAIVVGRPV
eukprot:gene1582-964_t